MVKSQRKNFPDNYRAFFLSAGLLLMCLLGRGQTYSPGQHVVVNDAIAPAQAVPSDARAQFYDGSNFVYRDYNGTSEVLSYLNLGKYRFGHFPLYVHVGGSLSGGVWTGGTTQIWWFKNGTADSNLVRWYNDSTGASCAGCLLAANNLSDLSNIPTARGNLGLGTMAVLNSSAGGDLSGVWPNITTTRFNGQLPSYYLNYNNLTNKPVGLSLTTTGTSGVATYNSGTGILNIPNYATGGGGACLNCNADTIGNIPVNFTQFPNFGSLILDSVNSQFIIVAKDSIWRTPGVDSIKFRLHGIFGEILDSLGSGGGGAVSSVSNSDGSLTITPTTGAVVSSLNTAHSNTWSVGQTFNGSTSVFNGGLQLASTFSFGADNTYAIGSSSVAAQKMWTYSLVSPAALNLATATSAVITMSINGNVVSTLKTTGQLQLNNYTTSSSFTGTPLAYLQTDASGNVIQIPVSSVQGALTLTTTGTSGAATLIGNTLNIPQYSGGGAGLTQIFGKAPVIILGTDTVTVDTTAGSTHLATQGYVGRQGFITLASLSASSPLAYNNTTGAFSIQAGNGSQNGYITSTDWNTFNGKQLAISLTTTGTSGAATFLSNTLNIPQYQGALTLTTTGTSGAATLISNTLNIPQYSGGGGSQTFPQVLATGRTFIASDSVILAAATSFTIKGALTSMDTIGLGKSPRFTYDTMYHFGDSKTIGIFPSDYPFRWTDITDNGLQLVQVNLGVSGSTINQGSGAANSMQARLATIPVKTSRRAKMTWWFATNDMKNGLSIDSFRFGYHRCLDTAIARGWTGADIIIMSGWLADGTLQATQQQYHDSCAAIAAFYGATFVDFFAPEQAVNNRITGNGFYHDGTHEAKEGHNWIANFMLPRVKTVSVKADSINVGTANGMIDADKIRFHTGDTLKGNYVGSLVGLNQENRLAPIPTQYYIHNNPWDSAGQTATINLNGMIKGVVLSATGIPTAPVHAFQMLFGFAGGAGLMYSENNSGGVVETNIGNGGKVGIGNFAASVPTNELFYVQSGGMFANYYKAGSIVSAWNAKEIDMSFDSLSAHNWGIIQSRGTVNGVWYTTKINPLGGEVIIGDSVQTGFGFSINRQMWINKDSLSISSAGTVMSLGIDTVTKQVVRFAAGGGGSQTWQQTLTVGSTLNTTNSVTNTGQSFTWSNGGTGTFKFSGILTDTTNAAYVLFKKKDSSVAEMTFANFAQYLPSDTLIVMNGLTQSFNASGTQDTIRWGGTLTQNSIVSTGVFSLTLGNSAGTNIFIPPSASYIQTTGAIAMAGWNTNTSTGNITVTTSGHYAANYLDNPPSSQTSFTFTLPPSAVDGEIVNIHFGGTITNGSTVTSSFSVVVPGGSGMVIFGATPSTTAISGDYLSWRFYAAGNAWYREH